MPIFQPTISPKAYIFTVGDYDKLTNDFNLDYLKAPPSDGEKIQ